MTIKLLGLPDGAVVHLNRTECELLMQLACNAEKVNGAASDTRAIYSDESPTYLSVSLALGRRLLALADPS